MKFKVAVGINYYDDLHGLVYGLEAKPGYYDKVDKIYLINGKYEGRKDLPEYNPIEIELIPEKYPKVEIINMHGVKQITKRNMYFDMAEADGMDYLIVLDSDEWLDITDTTALHSIWDRPESCFPIFTEVPEVTGVARPRLFKAPFDYRHVQSTKPNTISHGSLWREGQVADIISEMYAWYLDHPGDNRAGIPGFKMYHDKQFRSRDRVIRDRVYYDEVKDR